MDQEKSENLDIRAIQSEVRRFLDFQRDLGGAFLPGSPEPETSHTAPVAVSADDAPETHKDLLSPVVTESPYERINALIPPGHPLLEMEALEEVNAWVAANELIPIDAERINAVPGIGRDDADLMVVGEAPGADEDRTGEPFVGRAGKLLTEILKAIHFERSDVYIANILKSRPPNNRAPLPDEVAAHLPILLRQIALIKPKIILCVGRSAGNSLLQRNESMGTLRGQFHNFHGIPMAVTYHPAALLRNSEWKRPTWEDVQMVRARYDELVAPDAARL
jgi:uracil-DNA glycosylase